MAESGVSMSSKIKLVFISGPYRASTRFGTEKNVRNAEEVAIEVAKLGAYPICPHANTRTYFEDLQTDEFWLQATRETLRRCDAVIFVSGWKQSEGSLAEYEEARRIGLPTFLHLREVKEWLSGIVPKCEKCGDVGWTEEKDGPMECECIVPDEVKEKPCWKGLIKCKDCFDKEKCTKDWKWKRLPK